MMMPITVRKKKSKDLIKLFNFEPESVNGEYHCGGYYVGYFITTNQIVEIVRNDLINYYEVVD